MWQPVNAQTNQPWWPTAKQWPIALHAGEKEGGSFFTVVIAAACIRRNQPTVFLCARAEAVRSLKTELHLEHPTVESESVDTSGVASKLHDSLLVTMIHRPNYRLVDALRALPDWQSRTIIIKNVESVLTPELWSVVAHHQKLLLSGDFLKLNIATDAPTFPTKISFSEAPTTWQLPAHHEPKYVGQLSEGKKISTVILREKED